MRQYVLFAAFQVATAAAAYAEVTLLSQHDLDVVTAELSAQMLDPNSTIVSDVIAGTEPGDTQGATWVCGQVRGKNTFGGYAQPTPFMGMIFNSPSAGRTFFLINVAGPSESEKAATISTCLGKIQGPRAVVGAEADKSGSQTPMTPPKERQVTADSWDECVRALCSAVDQPECWIKAGAAICDVDQAQCNTLPEATPAIAIEKIGERWSVVTKDYKGWVSSRMMMIQGGSCSY